MRLFAIYGVIGAGVIIALAAVGLSLIGLFGSVPPVQAQSDAIQVLSHRAESHFPDSVRFFIEAAGPDEIDDIRVYMKTIGQASRSSYRQVEFTPGRVINGEAELLSGGNNYLPPGARIGYSFEIRDVAGRSLRTEEEIFVYLDTRFEWHTVSEGLITVYYNNSLAAGRAQHVLETAVQTLESMGPVLGSNPEYPLHIVAYHSYRDMAGALPFRSQTTANQLQMLGMAFDEERVLMIYSGSPEVTRTTIHEFIHLLVGDATGLAYSQVPAWLNEGLAEYGSEGNQSSGFLDSAMRSGQVRPLWHLASYSGTPQDILVAYDQGRSVVSYLIENHGGFDKMAELMRVIVRQLDIDRALEQVYGFDQYGLDAAWRQHMGLEPLPRPTTPTPWPRTGAAYPTIAPLPPTPTPVARQAQSESTAAAAPEPTLARPPVATSPPEPPAAAVASAPPAAPALDPHLEPKVDPGSGALSVKGGALANPTEEPAEEPEAPASQGTPPSGGGCNAGPATEGALGGELALLALMVSPAALLAAARARGFKRRRR